MQGTTRRRRLVATRLDRVGRSTSHLVTLLDELAARGVAFRFLEQGIDTTTSEGRLMYRMLAAIAEFQRDLIIAIIYTQRRVVSDVGLRHAC